MPLRPAKTTTNNEPSANAAGGLVPRLRFPEFQCAGEWTAEPMGGLYSFLGNNTLSRDQLNYQSGAAKNVHYGDIHTKFATMFDITREFVPYVNESESVPQPDSADYCQEGDLIFADASEDTNDVGKSIELVRLKGERLLAGQHTILARRRDTRLVLGFGGHLFRSERVRSQIRKEAQGTKVYAISATRLGNIEIAYPGDHAEQQKIADCLTSLDEVIAAQGRKVAALKAHKKGLMQHLFPQEGQTLPRLRFPEFRDEPEWRRESVEDFAKITTGDKDTQDKVDGGEYPFFVRSQTVQRINSYAMDCEAVLTSGDGVGVGDDYHYIVGKFNFHQRVYCIYDFRADVSGRFFFSYFSEHFGARVKQMSAKNSVDSVRRAMIAEMPIGMPSLPEQQRIAACLSTLDARLDAEAANLDALKAHKTGLMQQLFPSPEGV